MSNIEYIPNGMPPQNSSTSVIQDDKLHILYVGELSKRKGIDRLIEVITEASDNFIFTIAGDGPYKKQIQELARIYPNCIYEGFVPPFTLSNLYKSNEILFLPSRAESMPLSILEALSYGLVIVNSPETSLELDETVEFSSQDNTAESYLNIFYQLYKRKKSNLIVPASTKDYFEKNFSSKIVDTRLFNNIFSLNI